MYSRVVITQMLCIELWGRTVTPFDVLGLTHNKKKVFQFYLCATFVRYLGVIFITHFLLSYSFFSLWGGGRFMGDIYMGIWT